MPAAKKKPNVIQAVPFFFVTDIQQSLRFYVDGLGFEMTKKWVDQGRLQWCWLQLGGAALMLQEFRTEGHGIGAEHTPPLPGSLAQGQTPVQERKLGQGVTICFICRDALQIYRDAVARGLLASRPFVGNAMWVTSLTDPDGYRIDFESDTDVPEGSLYSEGSGG
jgi:lactoylglutathione lyase